MRTPRYRMSRGTVVACVALSALAASGCDKDRGGRGAGMADRSVAADDSARTVRDGDAAGPSVFDQGESEGDRRITQHIRKSLVDDDRLSTGAQNVKIITQNGIVTLRGAVDSDAERTTIAAAARSAPGVRGIEDQLEVDRSQ